MRLSEGFTFGINEVVMTVLCGISGYLSVPRKQLLYFLLVLAISSIIPDAYSYYQMQRNDLPENKAHSVIESLKNTYPIILSEAGAVLLISIPLMIFNNKVFRAIGAVFIGISLIIVTKLYSDSYVNIYGLLTPAAVALLGAVFTFVVSVFLKKYI